VTQRKTDVEAYVLSRDLQGIASALSPFLGCVQLELDPEMQAHIWLSDQVRVIVQDSADCFVSVWVIGQFPWSSDIEFARLLASQLQCTVRCDPNAEHPQTGPCTFLEISAAQEQLIEWSEDQAV
jgi:hypothetical protein